MASWRRGFSIKWREKCEGRYYKGPGGGSTSGTNHEKWEKATQLARFLDGHADDVPSIVSPEPVNRPDTRPGSAS
jgi:hypothetical protein